MITWPTSFPKPNVDFNHEVQNTVARTEMDSGRVRQRKRFSREYRQMKVTWTFTDLEWEVFQSVYKWQLADGADWFTMSLPLGDGFRDYTVRFVADKVSAAYDDVMYWKVSALLETEDDPTMSEEATEAIVALDLDIDAFESAVSLLDYLVNTYLPELA